MAPKKQPTEEEIKAAVRAANNKAIRREGEEKQRKYHERAAIQKRS
jgi:hypothetical protein